MLIAQISDIHASPGNDGLARLKRAISWLATMQPDIVVVSGDLVNGGWREGYRQILAALQSLACRTLMLPGNADDRTVMREEMPVADYWGGDGKTHFAEPHGDALIVGLDTCVDGYAHGDVAEHLAWLRQTLASGRPGIPLLFTHHHVFPTGISPLDGVMCRGADALGDLLSTGIRRPIAVCSGHVHRQMSSLIAGIPAHICGSICPANPLLLDPAREPPVTDPPALMIHDLRNGRLISSHVST
ncbi:calcineurin-like phosphoesterase domain-containing protein [Rhizobium etli 8C-3]|uniref:3',5'-cyclic AMP phosphodiesterase CpdA n=2 Tax=Rhizobium TaxID=379 RepID=A0A4R3RIG0_9HYPH|nr:MULTISPECIES: metallophosphoesterase [Rhizobium]APO73943.1 calcineurin-like phosphoesterase domain-containing protein [Rhizobium etli 8C-3]TCU27707.1 3',5'-cyclic AMP phosphodiesterase CpdA [Rhizobium azibense]TCU34494.1 3',5'-cyclic AMP phosphodiesterase CpdA [Rhizobium azibense]